MVFSFKIKCLQCKFVGSRLQHMLRTIILNFGIFTPLSILAFLSKQLKSHCKKQPCQSLFLATPLPCVATETNYFISHSLHFQPMSHTISPLAQDIWEPCIHGKSNNNFSIADNHVISLLILILHVWTIESKLQLIFHQTKLIITILYRAEL